MTDARAKAPALAWLLTAVSCLLVGMAITEVRSYASAPPAPGPADVAVTVETAAPPTLTPAPTPTPSRGPEERLAPHSSPLVEDVPVGLAAGPARLRVARLTVPPGVGLPFEAAPGPTVLLVEAGVLLVRVDSAVWVGTGIDAAYPNTVLSYGERLVIAPHVRYAVRNDGPTPAEALVVAIVAVGTSTPMLGPGEPLPSVAA
jgi:hypothetical protein